MSSKQLSNRREVILKYLSKAKAGYTVYQLMDMVQENSMTAMRYELNCLSAYLRVEDRICCRECGREYSTYHLSDKGRIYLHHVKQLPTFEEAYGYPKDKYKRKPK